MTRPPIPKLVAESACASAVSLAGGASLAFAFGATGSTGSVGELQSPEGWRVFGWVLVSPLLETLVMGALLSWIFLPRTRSSALAILMSSVVWGLVHGLADWISGIANLANFAVFSFVYVRYLKFGAGWAVLAASITQAIHNSVVATLLVL